MDNKIAFYQDVNVHFKRL